MLDRLVPPWLLVVAAVVLFGALGERWWTILIIALIAGHFALKHYGHEGLFGGKHKGEFKDD